MGLTLVYDNNAAAKDVTSGWGFVCVVRGIGTTILFDAGAGERILLANMRALGIEPSQIDVVVINHAHGDHTGGLDELLALRPGVFVYIPTRFPKAVKAHIGSRNCKLVETDGSLEMGPRARTAGTLGKGTVEEDRLCVKTKSGWVLITGCGHLSDAEMAARAKELTGGPIAAVVGGWRTGLETDTTLETQGCGRNAWAVVV